MTTTAEPEALPDAGPCAWCTHLQWSHKRGKGGCTHLDCGGMCDRYTPPKDRPAPANDWPLPQAEIEDAEAAGLVVRPESPAVEESVVAAALGELHVLPADEPAGPVDPVEVVDVARRRRREPAPLPGGDPEPDPAAQAEHAEQVAAIDEQLAQPGPEPEGEPQPVWPDCAECRHTRALLVEARDQRNKAMNHGANKAAQLDAAFARIAQLEQHVRALTAERNDERTANAALHRELAELESFAARERGARSAELAQVREELNRAVAARQRLQEQLDQAVHTGLNAATQVIGRYTAHACLTCGARYGKPYTDHGCGPLVPVVVTIARADRPGSEPSKEQ